MKYGNLKIYMNDGTVTEYKDEEWDDLTIDNNFLNIYKIVDNSTVCIAFYNSHFIIKIERL